VLEELSPPQATKAVEAIARVAISARDFLRVFIISSSFILLRKIFCCVRSPENMYPLLHGRDFRCDIRSTDARLTAL
jgi:hypothetical protein